MSLMQRLIKNSTIADKSILSDSKFFTEKDMVPTDIPMLNVALSARLDGGLTPGLTMIAGPSKHFKTCFSLIMAAAYLKKYDDAIILFYDSEFGTPQGYFEKFGIDTSRVLHIPITNVEVLKHDIMVQLKNIERGDRVCIVLDSLGNLASLKEVEDAENGKTVADMSRAKQFKSLFRMVTPHLTIKNIPMIVVNHTYKEIGLYPKDIVGGGTGSYYSSDTIWIVGRQQEKEGTEITGYNFIINIEKSRYVKEKSKIPITVMFDGGIERYSGLFDVALASGYIKTVSSGWYSVQGSDAKRRKTDIEEDTDLWEALIADEDFNNSIMSKYALT